MLLARYGREGVLQDQQDRGKAFISLSQPDTGADTFEYRLTLDVEGKAVLEAALGPLSAPKPVEGERDLRTSDRRRGEAFVQIVRRAVAAGEEGGKNNKTTLVLTMDWESLRDRLGAATTLGGLDAGTHLAPETVRGCAATPRSSRSCSAPAVRSWTGDCRSGSSATGRPNGSGCGTAAAPIRAAGAAAWADAHHLIHWADLGPSDLDNAALLCDRHHTIVHRRRLAGQLVTEPANGSNGTSPPAATTTCSPGVPPRNQRDPAPHPADRRRGHRHVPGRHRANPWAVSEPAPGTRGRPGRVGPARAAHA